MTFSMLFLWAVFGLVLSGCTVKATTDTTTDGTTEFVSSTSGKTWWTEEGLVKQGHHAKAFVSVNYDHLLEDIARGEGEYLLAFGSLLNVPPVQQKTFANRLQRHFADLLEIPVSQGDSHLKQFINQVVVFTTDSSWPHL